MTALILRNAENLCVEINSGAQSQKHNAIEISKGITNVSDAASQWLAVASQRELQSLLKLVEKSRTEIKAPVLDAGRKIDELAKSFSADLKSEADRLSKLVTAFQIEEQRKADEAERARQAEAA